MPGLDSKNSKNSQHHQQLNACSSDENSRHLHHSVHDVERLIVNASQHNKTVKRIGVRVRNSSDI